jgi:hypothetical protein
MVNDRIDEFGEEFGLAKGNHRSPMVDDQGSLEFDQIFHATNGNYQSSMVDD